MRLFLSLLVLSMLCTGVSAQSLQLFEAFTDHAILQRGIDVPFWGWAKPGRKVQITFDGLTSSVKADSDGQWMASLSAQEAGGPHTVTVTSGREQVTIEDVYFGDVYLLSGQSNMEWRLAQSDPDGKRSAAIADPLIRELKVDHHYSDTPQKHLKLDEAYGQHWMIGTANEIGKFSGVGSYFAHYLRKEVDVPIGLIHSSWGGSRIEPWLSAETLGIKSADAIKDNEGQKDSPGKRGQESFMRDFPGRDLPGKDEGEKLGWLQADHNDSAWPTMTLPGYWEAAGYPSVDGYFYFRRSFTLTPEQAEGGATLHLGAIDDGDYTYLNDQLVGSYPNAYATPRDYRIAPGVLKAGENKLSIRVFDGAGQGGFAATPEEFYLETSDGNVSMAGEYKYNVGEFRVDIKPNQVPTILYNAMIAPLEGMPLAGVLWYQGESNAGNPDNLEYAELMRKLIRQWRGFFTSTGESLPFYWVQLANWKAPVSTPNEPGWAVLRESQTQALSEPLTGMAVITDIGEADDIHPKNKWEVGRRLSLFALRDIYGKERAADSPSFKEYNKVGEIVLIRFQNAPAGLKIVADDRYKTLRGFTLQDESGDWHFAQAVQVEPGVIAVINPQATGIKRIRYNWADNPDGNLFSKDGLPANAFDQKID